MAQHGGLLSAPRQPDQTVVPGVAPTTTETPVSSWTATAGVVFRGLGKDTLVRAQSWLYGCTWRQVNGSRFVRQKRGSERQNQTSAWLQIDMPRAGIRQSLRRYTPLNHTSAGRIAFFPKCNAYLGHP